VSSTLTEATRELLRARGGDVSLHLDVVMVVLLLALLVEGEVLRAYFGAQRAGTALRVFQVALAPLVVAFALVIAARWIELS